MHRNDTLYLGDDASSLHLLTHSIAQSQKYCAHRTEEWTKAQRGLGAGLGVLRESGSTCPLAWVSLVGTWGWVHSSSAQHRAGHTARGGNTWPRGAVQPNPRVRRCLCPGLSSIQPPRAPTPGNPCLVPSPEMEPVAQTSADQGTPGSSEDAWPKPVQQEGALRLPGPVGSVGRGAVASSW